MSCFQFDAGLSGVLKELSGERHDIPIFSAKFISCSAPSATAFASMRYRLLLVPGERHAFDHFLKDTTHRWPNTVLLKSSACSKDCSFQMVVLNAMLESN